MPRKPKHTEPEVDVSQLTPDQQADLLTEALSRFTETLLAQGFDPEVLAPILLEQFASIMCDLGDRQAYEEVLEMALEDEWPEHWLH